MSCAVGEISAWPRARAGKKKVNLRSRLCVCVCLCFIGIARITKDLSA